MIRPAVPELDYSDDPPARKWWKRWPTWLLLALWVGFPILAIAPGIVERATLYYWQQRCLAYAPPAQQVVYDETVTSEEGMPAVENVTVAPEPTAWRRLVQSLFTSKAYWYQDSSRSPRVCAHRAVLLLRERTSADGTRWLVVIELHKMSDATVALMARAQAIVGPIDATRDTMGGTYLGPIADEVRILGPRYMDMGTHLSVRDGLTGRLRFFAGQPDPADPSAFTLDYDKDGTRGQLVGDVNVDGIVKVADSPGQELLR